MALIVHTTTFTNAHRYRILLHLRRNVRLSISYECSGLSLTVTGGRKVVHDSDDEEVTEEKYNLPTSVVHTGN
jgi:hypothetical protein